MADKKETADKTELTDNRATALNGEVTVSTKAVNTEADDTDAANTKAANKGQQAIEKRIYALKFAAILCLVCSILLTGASVGLKPLQLENMEIDRQKNILKAAAILKSDANMSKDKIKAIYQKNIEEVVEEKLSLYLYKKPGTSKIMAYIIPIESRGLWGKIKGYLAVKNDGMTIAGFTVYSHSETPGLGGEIEKNWFGNNFIGKKIINDSGDFVSVTIAKGDSDDLPAEKKEHYVDGISGATLTGKYLSEGLRENLERYETVSVKFRQNSF
ncbi:NADH:ubiquinone oxidoreductase, subunit C [Desulfamplus magnetovallimortis]|uniref:Na(+)-translocating NADH-quinone reductase subunit C n=1 Tax=Desulfamplus magnetovallimortis TaxID=1246637 RepID=A0A1W1H6M6_9BACT|nr:FMN-binding protein [Desulfamplus magnetovallimortis]SLM28109.1 NADH:ubiquinone oxidoreductase, subunit C [Desulfamplus magnetovallimortis]